MAISEEKIPASLLVLGVALAVSPTLLVSLHSLVYESVAQEEIEKAFSSCKEQGVATIKGVEFSCREASLTKEYCVTVPRIELGERTHLTRPKR